MTASGYLIVDTMNRKSITTRPTQPSAAGFAQPAGYGGAERCLASFFRRKRI